MNNSSVFCEIGLRSEMTVNDEQLKQSEEPDINPGFKDIGIKEEPIEASEEPDINPEIKDISMKEEPLDVSEEPICSVDDSDDVTLKHNNQNPLMTCEICATDAQIIPLDNSERPSSNSPGFGDLESTNKQPKDRHTFENLKTEYDAFLFFQKHGVIPSEMICPNNHQMVSRFLGNSLQWCCSKKICRKKISARQNTWLDGSRIPLKKIIRFIHAWAEEYGSPKFYREELDLSSSTITDFQNSLRKVCAQSIFKRPVVIGGDGITVEIGKTCFTERKQRNGRPLPQQLIFGGFCRETIDVFLCSVPNTIEETFLECIKANIRPGSTIISDERKLKIENIEQIEGYNYKHITVNHSEKFVDLLTGLHTQNIERTWLDLRARNKRQNGTARQMLDSYLCEYVWRNRNCTNNMFKKILEDIANFIK